MVQQTLQHQEIHSPSQPTTSKGDPDTQPTTTSHETPIKPSAEITPKPFRTLSYATCATKRKRYMTHAGNQGIQDSRSRSGFEDIDSNFSTCESDSGESSSSDSEYSSRGAATVYVLPQNHRFQDIRPELVQSIQDSLERWMKTTRYVSPPDDRLPPRKRLRSSHWQEGEDSDDGFVLADHPAGYFHLACPFYVANPPKYHNCLLHHDLQSNEDVIRHIWRNHMKPPYCPICSQTFDSLSSRDSHILERTCKLRDLQPIDGINFYQKCKLKRRDRVYLGEAKRWRRIYATVFPDSDRSPSPYLDQECGKAVSMARDYWAANGRRSVSRFLESRKLLGEDEDALEALYKLALGDVLNAAGRRCEYSID